MVVETIAGSVTSTKQFVWSGDFDRSESRNGSGTLVSQYFSHGQINSATKYFYSLDKLGSIASMSDNAGNAVSQRSYEPFGIVTVQNEVTTPDFGYAGYYLHTRSSLNITVNRAFSSTLGRWLSRDPLYERLSPNLFVYVKNNPINLVDPLGLAAAFSRPYPPNRAGSVPNVCFSDCDTGDIECCDSHRKDCLSQCYQYYINKPGVGNDFLNQCIRCCEQTWDDCMKLDDPEFSGAFWERCFRNPVNRPQTTRRPPRKGAAAAPGPGGWWPRSSSVPPPRQP